MAINYKEEYKDAHDIQLHSLRRFAKNKDYEAIKMHVERIKGRDDSSYFQDMAKERFDVKVVHNASKNALKKFTKECHEKGMTIYGKKLKPGYVKISYKNRG